MSMDTLNKFAIVVIKPVAPSSTQFETTTVGYYVEVYRNDKFRHGVIVITGNTETSGGEPLALVSAIKVMEKGSYVLPKVKKGFRLG